MHQELQHEPVHDKAHPLPPDNLSQVVVAQFHFIPNPRCGATGAGDSGLNQIGNRRQFRRSSIKAQPGQEKLSID